MSWKKYKLYCTIRMLFFSILAYLFLKHFGYFLLPDSLAQHLFHQAHFLRCLVSENAHYQFSPFGRCLSQAEAVPPSAPTPCPLKHSLSQHLQDILLFYTHDQSWIPWILRSSSWTFGVYPCCRIASWYKNSSQQVNWICTWKQGCYTRDKLPLQCPRQCFPFILEVLCARDMILPSLWKETKHGMSLER